MRALVLAAGFATRLYPLTRNKSKCLITIKNKPIIEYSIERLKKAGVDDITIVSNNRFFDQFKSWLEHSKYKDVTLLNDNVNDEEGKLGTIGDLNFFLKQKGIEDTIVVNGDNIFDFDLSGFVDYVDGNGNAVLSVYDVKKLKEAIKFAVLRLDNDNVIIGIEEKPAKAWSTIVSIGIYYYPKRVLEMLDDYLKEHSPDVIGKFNEWICNKEEVYGLKLEGKWFDIGSFESLEEADRVFR